MPYLAPKPVVANVLATAAQWAGSGQTREAMRLLNRSGLSVADMRSYLISKRGLLNGLGQPAYLGTPAHKKKPAGKKPLQKHLLVRSRNNMPPPHFAGLGAAAPAPVAPAPLPTDPDIETQLSQIRFDWPSGTLYVGANKYSILTTLIGGLVVKAVMWGLSKGGSALKGAPAIATAGAKK